MNTALSRRLGPLCILATVAAVRPDGIAVAAADAPAIGASDIEPAQPPATALLSLQRVARSIERRTLPNGLRLVLAPDGDANTVGVSVTYAVGSRDEGPRQSGFAHLFEHMMFQGSQHVPKGGHFTLIAERGGSLNGTTSADRTNYFEVLPSSELALAMWLEADRMRALSVTRQNFENQRAVVQEEFRMRYLNTAYMAGMIRLNELVFADYPPYRHPTIGSMEDLANAKLDWVQAFYARHYTPDRAVLTVAGNFEQDQALSLARYYFGDIRKQAPPREPLPSMPSDVQPRRAQLYDNNAKTPGFYLGFSIPPSRSPEH
jgi:predicted Zn-dependent peptidase